MGGGKVSATFYVGDSIQVMNTLPEKSVDLILTSPPFLALRSYLPQDHPDKALEGGSQATPGEYIDWLLDVVEACARVLAPHGSLCFELGDTYSGSGQGRNWGLSEAWADKYGSKWASDDDLPKPKVNWNDDAWPLAKSLSLIPESFRFAMVYGHNPHTGRQTEPWRLRNVIRWVRPNPPVGALGDKFRPATSELMVFCKAKNRFFDLDAVREPYSPISLRLNELKPQTHIGTHGNRPNDEPPQGITYRLTNTGAPPLDWWNVPLLEGEEPSKGGPKSKSRIDEISPKRISDPRDERVWKEPGPQNPAGAPPLDWWNIPLLDGDEETRYGKKNEPRDYSKEAAATAKRRDAYNAVRAEVGLSSLSPSDGLNNPIGAPPLDWWNIPPGGYPGAHYAVWPPELLVKPIKAMCPEKVCRRCGEPSRRIVGEATYGPSPSNGRPGGLMFRDGQRAAENVNQWKNTGQNTSVIRNAPTLGFSDCGHDDYRPGLVLDPFAGSGTTLSVATGHGRDAIGIDLDSRNVTLARDRIGPLFFEVVDARSETDRSDDPILAEGGTPQ